MPNAYPGTSKKSNVIFTMKKHFSPSFLNIYDWIFYTRIFLYDASGSGFKDLDTDIIPDQAPDLKKRIRISKEKIWFWYKILDP